jgi:hypothetical protein
MVREYEVLYVELIVLPIVTAIPAEALDAVVASLKVVGKLGFTIAK